jgi:hypothetical protein
VIPEQVVHAGWSIELGAVCGQALDPAGLCSGAAASGRVDRRAGWPDLPTQ